MWSRLFKNKIAKAASGANGNGEGAATPSAPVNETTSANKKRGRKTKNTAATDYDDDEEAAAPIKSTKRKCTAVAKSIEKGNKSSIPHILIVADPSSRRQAYKDVFC